MRNMRPSIMIVEDSDSFRMLLNTMFHRDYKVITARDGLEAIAWLAQGQVPDVILMDIHMPKLDGAALLRHIKTSGLFRSIPVVILSGSEEQDELAGYLEMGANAFFLKPFNPVDLKKAVKKLISGSDVVA